MKEKTLKLGELFCGPGGFGQGANLSKLIHNNAKYTFEHEWATDIDIDSCKTYETNIKKCKKILVEDIKKIFRKIFDLIKYLIFEFLFILILSR